METTLHATDRNLDYEKVQNSLVEQTREYVAENAKSKACIVGVSGGIDSAVVSTLAAKTQLKTVLLTMPIHQNPAEVTRAQLHIQALQEQYPHVVHHNIDLTDTYETIKNAMSVIGKTEDELYMSLVNTRSRLRMVTLYAVAQANQGIVLGTGNKVEDYGIGFFTKYGDGGVDYSPIGELLKSEVRGLAKHMGVNNQIVEAKPTDGLHSNGATDEDQIGATYDELERAMTEYDLGKRANDYAGDTRENEVMKIYQTRHEINAHKMSMPEIAQLPL